MNALETFRSLPIFRDRWYSLIVVVGAAAIIGGWLFGTPPGLLGKADAIGYAVCHRIDGRSFHLGDRQLPLCARCTGIYLGAMLAMIVFTASGRGKAGGLPSRWMLAVLGLFIAAMGFDGINSYLTFFPRLPHLYEPQNWLRLTTGMFAGIAAGTLVFPSFNATLWRDATDRRVIENWRELGGLIVLGASLSLTAFFGFKLW